MEVNTESKVETTNNEDQELHELVRFKAGNEEFVADISHVQEIIRMMEITSVPNAPEFVDGIINLRGKVIVVINLRQKLGLSKKDYDNNTRVIVVEVKGNTVGFIVDDVTEVIRIPINLTEASPELVTRVGSYFISGVVNLDERLLLLIKLEKILSFEEVAELLAIV